MEQVKKRDVFNKYGEEPRKVLEALLGKYAVNGISLLENSIVLKLDPFHQMGAPAELLADYYKKYAALAHEIDKTLSEIQKILGIEIKSL